MDRVQKLLSAYGYCSRRKAEELISQGRVKVNGNLITIGDKASSEDKISVDNQIVKKPRKMYFIFHKPEGCVTAKTDPKYKTVMDYVRENVNPVGRLDMNTSGLLLMTNDGDFANNVMHPRYEVEKTYLVELDKPIKLGDVKTMEKGVELDDGRVGGIHIIISGPRLVMIKLHVGKNRVVRRIFEKFEYKVKKLKRISVGKLRLGDLKPGKYRKLTPMEIDLVLEKRYVK